MATGPGIGADPVDYWTTPVEAVTVDIPERPGKVRITSATGEKGAADGVFTIEWAKPSGDVNTYKIQEYYKRDGVTSKPKYITINKDIYSYTPPKKSASTTYYYKIKGCNELNQCSNEWSDPRAVKVRTNEKPTVRLQAPTHGKTYRPGDIKTIYATASDYNGINQVEFFRSASSSGSKPASLGYSTSDNGDCNGCYRINWPVNSISGKNIYIWAVAKDTLGLKNTIDDTNTVKISILANEQPVGWLNSLPSSITQYDNVVLTATASDNDGSVASVEFFVGGSSLGIDRTSPYTANWNDVPDGNHLLSIVVTDNEGLSKTSNPVTASVKALDPPAPPSSLNIDGYTDPVPENTTGSYTVNWSDAGEYYVLEQLKVGVDSVFKSIPLANNKITGQYMPNQGAGTYKYRVYACNRAGCSSQPSPETSIEVVKESPKSPQKLVAVPAGNEALFTSNYQLQWDAFNQQEGGARPTYYVLQEKSGGLETSGKWTVLSSNSLSNSFSVERKSPGVYSYQVMACNVIGCSEPGEIVTLTVVPPYFSAAAVSCDGQCISLSVNGLDPEGSILLSAIHSKLFDLSISAKDLNWQSSTEFELAIVPEMELYKGLFELGVRVTAVNPNSAKGGITVYGDKATEIIGESQSAPTLSPDGTLYVGADEKLYALNTEDGSVLPEWPFTTGGVIKASPRIDGTDGTIYVGSLDHSLYAVTPWAIQKWRLETGGEIVSSVVIDDSRVLYFGSMDGVLYAVNAPNGSIKWTFPADGGIAETPVLAGNDTLYFTTVDSNQVFAIPRSNQGPGKLVWDSVDDSLIWEEIGNWNPNIAQLPEFLSVARLYRGLLQPPLAMNRKVLTFWTYQLLSGDYTQVDIARAFLNSDTGRSIYAPALSNTKFIDTLYERIFPGQGAPQITWGGVTYSRAMLLDMLSGGYSREQIAVLLTQSLEFSYATNTLLNYSFDYLYEQDYSWAVTTCDEGDEYTRDCDSDGLPDWWEILFLGSTDYDSSDDPDGDGITNGEAFAGNLSPCDAGCYNGIVDQPPIPAGIPQLSASEIKTSESIGALSGNFRVNETGAATYSIPLSVPVGTAGVAPELALSYSSRSGNGLLGQGWSLSGLSSISRCNKTLDQDGKGAAVSWSKDDRFCLNGRRLVLVEGSYGKPGSQYRTEIDTYVLVTAKGGTAGHPSYFTVESKDGSISYFGDGNKSQQTISGKGTSTWAISRTEDSAGNGINYIYANDGGHRIREIRYAYGAGAVAEARVSFTYDDRMDVINGYFSGSLLSVKKRMTGIEIFGSESDALHRYEIDYLDSGYDHLSRIEYIRECAGNICRPDTAFEWHLPSIMHNPQYSDTLQLSKQLDRAAISPQPADINGDGLLDIIWLEPDWDPDGRIHDQYFKYVLASGDSFTRERLAYKYQEDVDTPYQWSMIDYNADGRSDLAIYVRERGHWVVHQSQPSSAGVWNLPSSSIPPIDLPVYEEDARFIDINGDGLADAVSATGYQLLEPDSSKPNSSANYYKYGNKRSWTISGLPSWGELDSKYESTELYLDPGAVGDFNNDGRVDLVFVDTKQTWEVDLTNFDFSSGRDETLILSNQHTRVYYASIDGDNLFIDGKLLDFVQASWPNKENKEYETTALERHGSLKQSLQVVDVNSDGLLDLITRNGENYKYRINTGDGFNSEVNLGTLNKNLSFSWFDYEGDGDLDVLWREEDGASEKLVFRRWQSRTNNFSEPETFKRVNSSRVGGKDIFLDMNGDGRTDYLEFHDDYLYIYHAEERQVAPNVISKITNGLGAETYITYSATNTSGHYAQLGIGVALSGYCSRVSNSDSNVEDWCLTNKVASSSEFYQALNSDWQHSLTLGKTNVVMPLLGNQFLVTRIESSTPAAGHQPGTVDNLATSGIRYFYGNALLQAGGRGHLGFESIQTLDEQTGVTTTTTYRQDFPFIGMPLRTEQRTGDGALLSEADNTWDILGMEDSWPGTARSEGTVSLGSLKPYISQTIESSYALRANGQAQGEHLKTVTTHTEQDMHGNATRLTVNTKAANGDNYITDTENDYGSGRRVNFVNPDHQLNEYEELGRLVSARVTHNRFEGGENDSAVRYSEFSYYENGFKAGLLKEEIIEPLSDDLRFTTLYDYDQFGNKIFAQQSAANEESRFQHWIYDVSGRFVDREENVYGQTTSLVLERNEYGQPTLVENISGVPTSFRYDRFGQQLLEYSATGSHKIVMLGHAGAQCPASAVYQVTERVGGGGESVTCFDMLARKIRTAGRAFDGGWNIVDIQYDQLGRVKHQSQPYSQGRSRYWTTQYYDLIGRIVGTDLPGVSGVNGTGYDVAVEYDGYTSSSINAKGQVHRSTKNALGDQVRVQDNLGNVQEFQYDAQGNLRFVFNRGDGSRNIVTGMEYDLLGRKTKMSDPDKGEWGYKYTAYGELFEQTDANGQVVINRYDRLGRLKERTDKDSSGVIVETTQWGYNNEVSSDIYGTPAGALREVVALDSGYIRLHGYDTLGRPQETITSFADGDDHYERSNYDQYGRVFQVFDAGGDGSWESSAIQHKYNEYGYLEQVIDAEQLNLATAEQFYTVIRMDARGNVTEYLNGNGITTQKFIDPATGRLTGKVAHVLGLGNIQELSYQWDDAGNLEYREDRSGDKDVHESFSYDGLNRLERSQIQGRDAQDVHYDDLGNITFKSDVGTYKYAEQCSNGAGPHAVCETSDGVSYQYDDNGNMTSDSSGRSLLYSTFDKPTEITKDGHKTEFLYGPERKRFLRRDTATDGQVTETRYIGNVEKVTTDGNTEVKRYLPGGALVIISAGQRKSRYMHTDHLGSLDVITEISGEIAKDSNGNQQVFSFDAWGQRRNAVDWSALLGDELTGFSSSLTSRGYTGHEMLDQVGLVHMNGRIYDPRLARFLQADPYVQSPDYSQSHNRYAYIWNNPLNSTDPSGYFRLRDWVGVIVAVVGAWICGSPCAEFGWEMVALGAASGAASAAANGGNVLEGALIGGISAAAYGAVGQMDFGGLGSFAGVAEFSAYGIAGGITSVLRGGKFGHGFVSAGVNWSVSGKVDGVGGSGPTGIAIRTVIRAVIGGTLSEATGGKFANGAATAAFASLVNSIGDSDDVLVTGERGGDTPPTDASDPRVVRPEINFEEAFLDSGSAREALNTDIMIAKDEGNPKLEYGGITVSKTVDGQTLYYNSNIVTSGSSSWIAWSKTHLLNLNANTPLIALDHFHPLISSGRGINRVKAVPRAFSDGDMATYRGLVAGGATQFQGVYMFDKYGSRIYSGGRSYRGNECKSIGLC
ncbi:Ig-like domain-containing protein [Microbulbifer sp. SSSA005]|uniref:Ig-like domain-containing protein n=1 Tax=Microbulbifer sp. SSSA005 TaxID=3243378 RepID=UPI00403959AF